MPSFRVAPGRVCRIDPDAPKQGDATPHARHSAPPALDYASAPYLPGEPDRMTCTLLLSLVVLGAYLLGSIPFGWIVARARGVDILRVGSGNIGATNVARRVGLGWGLLVFLLDFAKGAVPAFAA